MTVVFLFVGVTVHEAGCGSASLSATEIVRTQAAQLTSVAYSSSSAQCLLYNAVIGDGAELNLFKKHVCISHARSQTIDFFGGCFLTVSLGLAIGCC